MNEIEGVCIYLAMPIDRAGSNKKVRDHYRKVSENIANHLDTVGIFSTIFLPGKAYCISGPPTQDRDAYVIDINEYALSQADIMVVVYVPGVESWGTPQEVYIAHNKKIPIAVFCDTVDNLPKDGLPLYLRARMSFLALGYSSLVETIKRVT